jgi:hypothetical protein
MGQILQKRPIWCARSKLERVRIDVHEEDLAAFEALADALNANDEASEHLRAEIERLLACDQISSAEEALLVLCRMTARH